MGEDLSTIGQFIILITSGAIVPLLLVLYKSRCKRICFGCIERDIMDDDDETKSIAGPQPEPEAEPAAEAAAAEAEAEH